MKVDFNQIIIGPDGKAVLTPDPEKPESGKMVKLTLKQACTEALCAGYRGEENLSGEEKYKRSRLATTINRKEQPVELLASEVVSLKECIAKRWPALIVGPAWDAIEPPKEEAAKPKLSVVKTAKKKE